MRDTGVAFKTLEGTEALPYMGLARTFLGILKNQMQFDGMQQGKWTRTLEDGTVIVVQSTMGTDKISISVPEPAPTEQPAAEIETPTPEEIQPVPIKEPVHIDGVTLTVVCGNSLTPDRAISQPWIWRPGQADVTLVDVGGLFAFVTAISGNGQVVVGTYNDTTDVTRAFRWDAQGGFVDLGDLGYTPAEAIATDVSFDGSVIVGSMFGTGGAYRHFVWENGSVSELAGSNPNPSAAPNTNRPPCVSPDGRLIGGIFSRPILTYGYTSHGPAGVTLDPNYSSLGYFGAVWQRQGTGYAKVWELPPSGLVQKQHIAYFGTLPITYDIALPIAPQALTNQGTVVGVAWVGIRVPWFGGVEYMYDPGSTPQPDQTQNSSSTSPTGESCSGLAGVSSSGRRSAGWTGVSGFVWSETRGRVNFGPQDQLRAIAPDGLSFAGCTGDEIVVFPWANSVGTIPMYWSAAGDTVIPLPAGFTLGWAADMAQPTIPEVPDTPDP